MAPKMLKVLPVGTALVQDVDALEGGRNAFVGRKWVPVPDEPERYGWAPTDEVAEVPFRPEYLDALKTGGLEPADADTAKLCGVAWKAPAPAAKAPKVDQ